MSKQKWRCAVLALLLITVSISGCVGGGGSRVKCKLTINVDGRGVVHPFFNETHEFGKAVIVDLEAVPAENWEFVRWDGDVPEPYSAKTTVSLDSDKTVVAVFRASLGTAVEVESGAEITFTNGVQLDFAGVSFPGGTTVTVNDVTGQFELPSGMN